MAPTWNEADVAIIGMAGRFPGADNVGELWRNLRDGVSSVRALTEEDLLAAGADPADLARPNLVKAVAMPRDLDRFDATFFGFNPREAEVLDPQQRLLLECAWEALENAGYVGEAYPGPTGVFAGVSTSTYLLYQVLANPAVVATLDPLHLELGNSGDYPTTRISHKLNLTGPSYHIQSACSTGLVAVHAACQSLLAEECDMALAGSASINVSLLRGYLYEEGGIVSPDGFCRVFDAKAQGSIVGGGVGIVVLKRLADAVADGDTVRAVIKGSAVNNDGALKVGYTAPSVEGQARVIAEALARSGVEAADVSYVEAHGTGTALGDPIEVEALTRAFGTNGRRQFCALGSVKTNVGHLATAAGVTGLIKTALALENGMIPPSLHFERPNPEIDFAASPFYVNTELRPWPRNGKPRRAGVSSFGFGGTNAHVVLEEAPELAPAQASPRPCQLLLLSAKTPGALEAATANLAAHLRDGPGLDLADVAYTLLCGRKAFGHRRALVCRDREEAVALLAEPSAQGVLTGAVERGDPGVAFLLPGLGDQHLHMAAGLYAAEPVFRTEVDRACALLERPLGLDLREVLYPAGSGRPRPEGLDLRRLLGRDSEPRDEAAQRLDRTLYAHPATFVVEIALARLWMDWGVKPRALLGYSLGEYAAACLSGVLGLEEALWLVTERARLIEELPAGAMLAVPLSEEEALARLGSGLSLAAVNAAEMCVVAGSEEAVAELEGELAREGIVSRRLRTSHAFHSRLLEPVAGRLTEHVRRLALKAPKIPYLSNVTGTWITGREATDPEYWGRHLCATVRLSAGLTELFQEPGRCLLEVGPGQTLSTFARQHPAGSRSTVVPSLGERAGEAADQAALLRAAGRLWLAGAPVDGARFFRHERRRRVPLPTYPFERQRYWIEASPGSALARPSAAVRERALSELEAVVAPEASLSEHPRPALRNAYVAPRDETERLVAGIWQKLLGVDEVGIHDDFFELGGHSFLTTRLVAELRELAGVELAVRDLFEKPTVAGFAAVVAAERLRSKDLVVPTAPMPQIVPDPASRHQPFPLTEVQQAYLFGRSDSFALGRVSTHFYTEVDVRGLDLERLTHAFRFLIDRHDMLRAVVYADGRQEILPEVPPYEIATLDLRGRPDLEAAEAIEAIRGQMSHQVRPSDRWPLYELRASLFDDDLIRLHFSFDFLIGDAWSLQVLQPELGLAYHHREAELPPLSLSFRDYVLAIAHLEEWPAYRRALAYWMDRLADFPPAPDLPLATSPAAVARPTFVRYDGRLDTPEWQRLKERAAQNGLTPSGLLLAAFAEVLTVWSASPRFTINLTLFNRLPLHPEAERLVGDFTSLTLLAIDNSRPAPFLERARRAQSQLFEDLDHSAVSGVRVLREIARRQGRHTPAMMPVVFTSTLNQAAPGEILEGLGVEAKWGYAVSQTPQVWIDHQVNEDPRGIFYSWDVVEELFPPGMIADMFAAYQALLARLIAEDSVWQEARPVLPPERQLELFAAANATEGAVPEGLLHAPFLALSESSPERVAVVDGDLSLTYGELAERAHALARRLRALGATPNSLVAVVMEKGWEQVVGVHAVLLSGAAYLPIDPELPRARRFYLFANGGVEIALTQTRFAQELEWPPDVRRLAVPRVRPAEDGARPLPALQGPRDLAYVIYTSGSTGNPKGVMIDHRGALNTVLDVNERFGVGPEDRVLALSSLSFDLSVYDVFGLLAAGGIVILPEAERSRDPEHWAEIVEQHGVTVWNTVPALMEMLADFGEVTGWRAPSLRLVLLSGDWISLRLPERIRKLAPNASVVSLGGATEASIWSILFPVGEVDPAWRSVPYGRPMRNQSFHVLDGQLAPRPVGVPGQLYIGGIGLAQGYWADPEKTAGSFLVDPRTGARLYRTGDLGRYLPDGTIEFLGREDFQVKVGGFRIELGEIESALVRHPEIREALVVAPAEAQGNRRLAAYFVPEAGGSPDPADLRAFLAEHLPAYMVPADFVALEAFPLTANGKIDRQALPLPGEDRTPAESSYVAPRGPVEELLAGYFREVLRVDRVGAEDDFFELGGNSLLAAQVTSRLRAGFGVEVSLRAFFEKPTLGELARVVEQRRTEGAVAPPLLPRSPGSAPGLPLSFSQQQLWFMDQLEPGSPVYNIPAAVELAGPLDVAVLAAAFAEVVRRHEALRTTFPVVDGEPVQEISERLDVGLPVIDLGSLPEGEREEEAGRLAAEEARRAFDLGRGPLLRTALLRLETQQHRALVTTHHIVSDGWSMEVLVRELGILYAAFREGRPSPLPELAVQYADFAVWQRQHLSGELLESELAWWRGQLAGAPTVLELPADHPRPPRQTLRGGRETVVFPLELGRELAGLAGRQGATLFMTLLAGLQALLARDTGEEDLLVGSPVANREPIETEPLIGFFVNVLVLRADLSGDPGFGELLRRAREATLGAYAHQALPFEKLVAELQPDRDPSRSPLVQVLLALQNAPAGPLELSGLRLRPLEVPTGAVAFDLILLLTETPAGLAVRAEYARDLFEATTVRRMLGRWRRLLESASADPEQRLSELETLAPGERQQLLVEWPAAPGMPAAPVDRLLHTPWARMAASFPERVAVRAGDLTLTYGELFLRAQALARQLRALGAAPGSLVAVVMEKGWEQVAGVFSVLLSGAAYLPVDPELPRARRFHLLGNGGVRLALTQAHLAEGLEWPPEVHRLAVTGAAPAKDDGRPLPAVQDPRGLAYVIYTSGSTGDPKGVMIDHQGALNTVLDVNERFGVGPEDRVLALSSLSFDLSVYDVFGLLAAGGTVILPEAGRSRDPQHWADLIDRHGVTVWNTVPALMEMLADFGEVTGWRAPSLRLVLLSGDWIPLRMPERVRRLAPDASVVSLGGATEASIWSILFPVDEVDPAWRSIPYGRPMRNQSFYVLDGRLAPCPVGVPGQLYIGGIGVAQGYWSDPEKTALSFVAEPRTGARLYRTGDLGRYLPDGTIEFLGRKDFQVKVGGFRIELGEIEAALARHPAIREALVLALAEGAGNRRLAAYFVPWPGNSPTPGELRTFLGEHLPAYMVPADFVALRAFPLTGNGKVDRQALPRPRSDRAPAEISYATLHSPVEELLAGLFREVLAADRVDASSVFFELGGNSLLAAQVTSRLRASFGLDLPLRTLFEKPTLGELARFIEQQMAAGAGAAVLPPLLPRSPGSAPGGLPLSFAQQRLWFLDQLEPGSPVHNIPTVVELTGPLDGAVLAAALAEVARRHEALRTTFRTVAGEPVQAIAESVDVALPRIDLGFLPEEERESEASRLATSETRRPFDLDRGPLLRAALLCLGAERHRVLVTMHHIVSDGWSMGLLVRELGALYEAFAAGRPSPLPELPVQYADFALWQRSHLSGEVLESELAWWRWQLAGTSTVLDLPADHPRPLRQTQRGGYQSFALPPELGRGLAGLAGQQGATLFMTLLAGFQALLAHDTGREDLLVGSPVANREPVETEPLIGFFVNTLVLRADLAGDPGFTELLRRVREATLGAYAHKALPFEKLVAELQPDRDPSRPPLVQVLFALQNAPLGALELPGLRLRPLEVPAAAVAFDLILSVTETPEGLAVRAEYALDLFEAATVRRMLGHWRRLLESVVAGPERRLSELETLGPEERQQLLFEWSATPGAPIATATLPGLFAAQVERSPDAPAVLFRGAVEESLTYRELAGRAGRLARCLRRLGVGPGSVVGICAGRSPGLIAALLAVLEAGGAYLPLDPAAPVERLALMLEDAGVDLLVTEERLLPALSILPESLRRFCLEALPDLAAAGGGEGGSPAAAVLPDEAAYVIYTSGSTGRPKGVVAVHRGLAAFAQAMADAIGLAPGDRVLQFASISFDASAVQIYPALIRGAAVVLHPDPTGLSTAELMSLCAEQDVTVLDLPAALWREAVRELATGGLRLEAPVRAFLTGGERLSRETLLQWSQAAERFPRPVRLASSYGPTEATVTSTLFELRGEVDGLAAPMGRPLPGVEVLLLDARLRPVPAGVAGEVYLGGTGLARGYLGHPEATAKSFVPHPFSGEPGSRLYRTGDLARRRGDGELEFLGRADQQVKIRGFRVETGEIEAALARHPAIRESVVVALADRSGDLRLAAYLVVDPEAGGAGTVTAAELRAFLKQALPDYMIPAFFVLLDALPLTSGGKVDRRALPAPEEGSLDSGVEFAAPATPVEESLAEVWQEVLGVARVGRHDNFFDLGGHSLLLTKLRQRIQERFGRELSMVEMFQHTTVAAMAEHLAAGGLAATPRSPEIPERGEALRQGRERLKQRGERQARRAGERTRGAS